MKNGRRAPLLFGVAMATTALIVIACSNRGGGGGTPPPTPTSSAPTNPVTGVLVEIDQMRGTPPIRDVQTLNGATVSLKDIYAPGHLDLDVRHDQDDLPSAPTVRLADLHALLTAFRSLPSPAPPGRHVHILVVTADAEDDRTLGIMFDFGQNDANDIPREGCAIFATPHHTLSGGEAPELLLTTAHELGHVFNLHHTDWEGDSFQSGSTIESYSMAGSVKWALSSHSLSHLLSHPARLVQPGDGSLPFGTITEAHAPLHKSVPGEDYVVVSDSDVGTARRAPGGTRAMAVRSGRDQANLLGRNAPLSLSLEAPKTRYLVGEPVILTVGLHNGGTGAREVLDLLDLTDGFLNIQIKRPNTDIFEPFRPAYRTHKRGRPPRRLDPGASLHAEAKLFFGAEGWTFVEPGQYVVRADYPADSLVTKERLQSEELTLEIAAPPSEASRRASGLMLGTEEGLFLLFNGGDHLLQGRENLKKVSDEAGSTPFAPAARLALGLSLLQPTIVSPGGAARVPDRLGEAERYLEGTLESDLPALSRLQAQQALAEALVRDNKPAEARAVRERTVKALEKEETAASSLREFQRKKIE